MAVLRTFDKQLYVLKCNSFGTAIADTTYYPASGSFIDVSNFSKIIFLIELGALTSDLTFVIREDTSATVTGSVVAVTGTLNTITCLNTDDNKWYSIELDVSKLDAGFRYVSLYGTGAAGGDDYACITAICYPARHWPVTQSANYVSAVVV